MPTGSPKSGSDCGCDLDRNNWAPRLGLAWSVKEKTVIRTGAGIFYGEANSLSTEGANFRSGPPRSADIAIQQNFERTNVFVQEGFVSAASRDGHESGWRSCFTLLDTVLERHE